jgi:hypothetical protein
MEIKSNFVLFERTFKVIYEDLRLSQSPFQFFFAIRMYAGKDFSHLQRTKFTGGFFERGLIGGVSLF